MRLGTNIPNNSNLNTYIDKGVFYCASGSIAQTLQNCPNTSSNFKLIVQINNKDSSGQIWGNQIIYVGGDNRNYIYSRGFNRDSSGSSFSSWQQVTTSNELIATLGGSIASNTDLNTLINGNKITMYASGYTTSLVNAPSGFNGGNITSFAYGGFGFQIAAAYNTTSVWMRNFYNGTWRSWVKIA